MAEMVGGRSCFSTVSPLRIFFKWHVLDEWKCSLYLSFANDYGGWSLYHRCIDFSSYLWDSRRRVGGFLPDPVLQSVLCLFLCSAARYPRLVYCCIGIAAAFGIRFPSGTTTQIARVRGSDWNR